MVPQQLQNSSLGRKLAPLPLMAIGVAVTPDTSHRASSPHLLKHRLHCQPRCLASNRMMFRCIDSHVQVAGMVGYRFPGGLVVTRTTARFTCRGKPASFEAEVK
jgi:hypothetical protein